MRDALIRLREPYEQSQFPQFLATVGRVYENDGETFDPSAPVTDFAVHTYPDHTYVYRPWYPSNARDRHIGGLLVDVEKVTQHQQEGDVTIVERDGEPLRPLVVGEEAVIAGLALGVVCQIVERRGYQLIERTADMPNANAARKSLGLRYDTSFRDADRALSAAHGSQTNVYQFTADWVQEYLKTANSVVAVG